MIFDKSIEQIAETQLLNALYRMSRADPFTASTMIHKLISIPPSLIFYFIFFKFIRPGLVVLDTNVFFNDKRSFPFFPTHGHTMC